jgi:hypothetical protein
LPELSGELPVKFNSNLKGESAMKKILSLVIALALASALIGCESKETVSGSEPVQGGEVVLVSHATESEEKQNQPRNCQNEQRDAEIPPVFDWGITLDVKDISPTGLTLVITQSGGNPSGRLEYGARYYLMRFNGETWEDACLAEILWDDIAYTVRMNTSTELAIEWERFYGSLPAGQYRIVKDFTDFRAAGDYDTESYWADFEILES